MTYRLFYSVEEVAKIWKCKESKIREYCQNGTIRACHVKGAWHIDTQALDEHEHKTTGKVPYKKICIYCSDEYGTTYYYPPPGWNGKNELRNYGSCDQCEKKREALFG